MSALQDEGGGEEIFNFDASAIVIVSTTFQNLSFDVPIPSLDDQIRACEN